MTIIPGRLTAPCCLVMAAALSGQLWAADPTTEARRLLREVINTYKLLDFYEDQWVILYEVIRYDGGEPDEFVEEAQLRFSRPNKMDLDFGSVRFLCDGINLLTVVAPLQVIDHKGNLLTIITPAYSIRPAPEIITLDTIKQSPIGWHPHSQTYINHYGNVILSLLLGDPSAERLLSMTGGTLILEADRVIDGKTLKSVFMEGRPLNQSVLELWEQRSPDTRLLIDPATKLIHRIEMDFIPQADTLSYAIKIDNSDGFFDKYALIGFIFLYVPPAGKGTWDARAISTAPLKDEWFECHPPDGIIEVSEIENPFRRKRPSEFQQRHPLDPDDRE